MNSVNESAMECDDSANSSDSKDSSKDEQMETDSPPKPDQPHWSSLLNDEEVSDDDTYCESDESDVTSSDESGDDDYQEYLLEQVHVDPKATEELPSIKVEPVSPRQDPVEMEPASDEWEAYSGLNLEEAIRLLKVRDRRVEELKQKLKNVQRDYASVKTQLKETADMNVESSLEPYNDIPVFNTSVDITTEYHERLCQYFRNFVMTEFDLRRDRSVLFRYFFRLSAFQKYYAVFVLKHALRARERNDVSEYEWLLKCYRNMPSFCNWMSAVLRVSSSIVVSFGQADCFGFSTSQTEPYGHVKKGCSSMHYRRVICSVLHGHATMVGRSTSHLCGNKRCLHPNHLYPENMTANLSRDPCHYGRKAGCKHVPGCLLSMKFNKYDDARADPNSFVKLVPSTVDLIGDLDFEVGQQISFPIDEILEYEGKKHELKTLRCVS
ncbi:hypothetical protein M3Y96_00146500 [Aphelenchoides besseyi]|nr:hypothetical protein M3Y96_00146500 [Aphelenchoides besseyi]